MAFASVPVADYVLVQGSDRIGMVRSSTFGHRCFCQDCGTPLYMEDDVSAATRDVSLATLDDPAMFPPGFHIFYASRIPWAPAADGLPRHDRSRHPNSE